MKNQEFSFIIYNKERLKMLEEINRLKEENENLKNQIQESEKLNCQHLETINKIINK